MTTREERALKIAELEKWDFTKPLPNANGHFHSIYKNSKTNFDASEWYLTEFYSSFNGLMPIVERVNKSKETNYFNIYQEYIGCDVISRFKTFYYKKNDYNKEVLNLIDALQEAIIYYYENKEQENEK